MIWSWTALDGGRLGFEGPRLFLPEAGPFRPRRSGGLHVLPRSPSAARPALRSGPRPFNPEPLTMRTATRWQEAALRYGSGRERACFFLEMRLGKCLTAIRWAEQFEAAKRWLWVGPASTLWDVYDELLREEEPEPLCFWQLPQSKRREAVAAKGVRWVLCSFEALLANAWLANARWDGIILDESPRIKNPKAQITKFLRSSFEDVPLRAALSGRPNPEGQELELFEQMAFVHGDFCGCRSYWDFRKKWFTPLGFDWVPKPALRPVLQKEMRMDAFTCLRRDVGAGSSKDYERRWCDLPPVLVKEQATLKREWARGGREFKYAPAIAKELTKIASGIGEDGGWRSKHKVKLLRSVLAEQPGEPAVVWSPHRPELDALAPEIEGWGWKVGVVHGGRSQNDRRATMQAFRKGKVDVLVMNPACARYGLDAARASRSWYFACPWSGEHRAQSEDRIIHLSKGGSVTIGDLLARKSVDEGLKLAATNKRIKSTQLLSAVRSFFLGEGLRRRSA